MNHIDLWEVIDKNPDNAKLFARLWNIDIMETLTGNKMTEAREEIYEQLKQNGHPEFQK